MDTLGGGALLAAVLFVGIIFARRESRVSQEYTSLLEQYRSRNAELEKEMIALRDEHAEALHAMQEQYELLVARLEAKIGELKSEIAVLQRLLKAQK